MAGYVDGKNSPPVLCIRGPSRSGKTSMAARMLGELRSAGLRVGYIKRSHHRLDLPEKSSGRIWATGPAAMLLRTSDRTQLNLAPSDESIPSLLPLLPGGLDLIVVETHTAEAYPTILSHLLTPAEGERVIGRWSLETISTDAPAATQQALGLVAADRPLAQALAQAEAFHGGRACAGLVLGTRLALHGAEALGVTVPDREKRLLVVLETQRCAADAVQAVTGCRVGRRTLQFRDYGKLAATFIDTRLDRGVRVAVRPDLRERATAAARPSEDPQKEQARLYREWDVSALFVTTDADPMLSGLDRPGRPRRRVACAACGEEIADGRDVLTESGSRCRPCANSGPVAERGE